VELGLNKVEKKKFVKSETDVEIEEKTEEYTLMIQSG
jgi:hypothetical protein